MRKPQPPINELHPPFANHPIRVRWEEIVGSTLSQHTEPLAIVGRRLVLACSGSVVAELRLHKDALMSKINAAMRGSVVTSVTFVQKKTSTVSEQAAVPAEAAKPSSSAEKWSGEYFEYVREPEGLFLRIPYVSRHLAAKIANGPFNRELKAWPVAPDQLERITAIIAEFLLADPDIGPMRDEAAQSVADSYVGNDILMAKDFMDKYRVNMTTALSLVAEGYRELAARVDAEVTRLRGSGKTKQQSDP